MNTTNIEQLLQSVDSRIVRLMEQNEIVSGLYGMISYHLGWVDREMRPVGADPGKRIRARLCLLSCVATGGSPESALAAATAVELVHNFSLIHDDIQDRSETRRHRSTVWALWGEAQAINTGDATFVLAQLALAEEVSDPRRLVASSKALNNACRLLCEGQYLDLAFEQRPTVSLDEYYAMIERKTAALLETACYLGALFGDAGDTETAAFSDFGRNLGLAFQMQDDYLGIWGDPGVTGKPEASDVSSRKKTLPLLYALSATEGGDRQRLELVLAGSGAVSESEVLEVLRILDRCGAADYTAAEVARWSEKALEALSRVRESDARDELATLCRRLAIRSR